VSSTTAAGQSPLTPGDGLSQTVNFVVTNPSSGHQNLATVLAIVTPGWKATLTGAPDCTASDFTVTPAAFIAGDVAPGGTVAGTTTITMKNLATNQDACKNATVGLTFVAS
jgi:hypothetical protein